MILSMLKTLARILRKCSIIPVGLKKKVVSTVYGFKDTENINAMYREFCYLQRSKWKQSSRAPDLCLSMHMWREHAPTPEPGITPRANHHLTALQHQVPDTAPISLARVFKKKRKEIPLQLL